MDRARLPNNAWNNNDPNELIDFPVSDAWLQHYHNLGMTPRCPQSNVQAQVDKLSAKLESIEETVRSMAEEGRQTGYSPLPSEPVPMKRKERASKEGGITL